MENKNAIQKKGVNKVIIEQKSQFIIYQTENGQTKLDVRLEDETVWLSQKHIEVREKLAGKFTVEQAFMILRTLKCKIYEDKKAETNFRACLDPSA